MSLPIWAIQLAKKAASVFYPSLSIQRHLQENFSYPPKEKVEDFSNFLKENYFGEDYSSTDHWQHLEGRLTKFRKNYIPWIDKVYPLEGAKILEIGGGTGSMTLALAEQKSNVWSIEVDKKSIDVAEKRLETYGFEARHIHGNGDEPKKHVENNEFDIVVYPASLEHMTLAERIRSLRSCWDVLKKNGVLIVSNSPNLLWHTDTHTSYLPFFLWLPQEYALEYNAFSPRKSFSRINFANEPEESFWRWGRGVSFHDFELAFQKKAEEIDFLLPRSAFRYPGLTYYFTKNRTSRRFKSIIKKVAPKNLPDGFFEEYIDVAIKKG